ncbi:MAG TPA: ABC transporter permease [Nitrososphaerales archaeon]|nr:ABC transporter permease [Nitrososphaerales archaeon]
MSTGAASMRRLITSNALSMFGLLTVSLFLIVTVVQIVSSGAILPYSAYQPSFVSANLPPSLSHPFGTDLLGRDMFSRVITALPIDVGIPLITVALSAAIGIVLGTLAAFFRGWLDEVLMRLTDLFMAFPTMIMAMAIAATLGPSLVNVTLSMIIVWWPPYVRLVRGGVLAIAAEDFVSISKALNSSFFYIVRKDAIPNVLPTILVYATFDVGSALLTLSTLGFLNVGIPPSAPELGMMVSNVGTNLFLFPYQIIIPAVVVAVIVAGFSFLGEGIREALDVKLRPHILVRSKPAKEIETRIQ